MSKDAIMVKALKLLAAEGRLHCKDTAKPFLNEEEAALIRMAAARLKELSGG